MNFPNVAFDPSISVGDVATAAAFLVALWSALRALGDFSKQLQEVKYSELDRLYFDLQRAALDYPGGSVPPPETGKDERSAEDRARYRIYAGMVWNFLETVEDRCNKDPALELTWYPVLLIEKRRHMAWMRDPANAGLFKESFRKRHCPECAPSDGARSPVDPTGQADN